MHPLGSIRLGKGGGIMTKKWKGRLKLVVKSEKRAKEMVKELGSRYKVKKLGKEFGIYYFTGRLK